MFRLTAAVIATAAALLLAAAPASAQVLWTGEHGDKCEVHKGSEIRCGFKRDRGSARSIRITLTAKAAVTAKVSHWRSLCGLPGEQRREDTLTLAAGESRSSHVGGDSMDGNVCLEAFVTCGSARCADAVTISATAN